MYCHNCGAKIDDDYNFCPVCGARQVTEGRPSPMRIDRRPGLRVEPMRLFNSDIDNFFDDFFKSSFLGFPSLKRGFATDPKSRSGGFSVKIVRGTDKEPKVAINTFGDFKGKESEIKKQIGLPEEKAKIKEIKPRKFEKTEEPECETCKKDGLTVVELEVPKVKSMADVDIAVYDESVEVRAYADKTAFFRIVKIPKGAKLVDKSLDKGKLTLRFK